MSSGREWSLRLRKAGNQVLTQEEHNWLLCCGYYSLLNAVQRICGRAVRVRAHASLARHYDKLQEATPALLPEPASLNRLRAFQHVLIGGVKHLIQDPAQQRAVWRHWQNTLTALQAAPHREAQCDLLESPPEPATTP